MAKLSRVIVRVDTKKDISYEVGKAALAGQYRVRSIEFRRDGLVSINHGGGPNCAHYLIVLENPMSDKDIIYKVIPYDSIESLMFIEVQEEKSSDGSKYETPTEMKRA